MSKMYGWFSKKSKAAGNGTSIYSQPDGKQVEVTVVTGSPKNSGGSIWDDLEYVGEITKWQRRGSADSGII